MLRSKKNRESSGRKEPKQETSESNIATQNEQSFGSEESEQSDSNEQAKATKQPKWADQIENNNQPADSEYPRKSEEETKPDKLRKQGSKSGGAGSASGCCKPCSTDWSVQPQDSDGSPSCSFNNEDSCQPCVPKRVRSPQTACIGACGLPSKSRKGTSRGSASIQPKQSSSPEDGGASNNNGNAEDDDEARKSDTAVDDNASTGKPEEAGKARPSNASASSWSADFAGPCDPWSGMQRPAPVACPRPVRPAASCPCPCSSPCGARSASRTSFATPARSCYSFPSYRPPSRCF